MGAAMERLSGWGNDLGSFAVTTRMSQPSARAVMAAVFLVSCGEGVIDGPDFELSCTVPVEELFSAATRDAIPALTNPEIATAGDGSFLSDSDRVLGVVVNGAARAYPFTVMWWHEVVNDTLGGQPILVTYCPLTGSGIAFDPEIDGTVRNFGVSGLLWRTNLTMFDRDTETLWNQMLMGSICGLGRGTQLRRIPIVETTWSNWKTRHSATTVVTENTGHERPYGRYPYGDYDDLHNAGIGFLSPSTRRRISDLRPPKELALGIFDGPRVTVYPFGGLAARGSVAALNHTVGDTPVLVTYQRPVETAMAFDRRVGGQTLTFTVASEAPLTLTDAETGSTWDGGGVAVAGPLAGERLQILSDAFVAFWFAWSIYYQELDLFLLDN